MSQYIIKLGISVLVLLLLFAATSIAIDPYDIWGSPKSASINFYKPKTGRHLEISKSAQLARLQAKTIVAGNSRVDVGLEPSDSEWGAQMLPVYNFGLPGRSLVGVTDLLLNEMSSNKPDAVFLGLDYLDFRILQSRWKIKEPQLDNLMERINRFLQFTLSIDALNDSVLTVLEQRKKYPATRNNHGFNGLADYNSIVANEGHKALFEQKENQNIKNFADTGKRVDWYPDNPESIALEKFLAKMKALDVKVVLFTYPYHGDILSAFRLTGIWSEFEAWKTEILSIALRYDIPLWDFAVLSSEASEQVPEKGDTSTKMSFYWEAGHFKAELGSKMIHDMVTGEQTIGYRLTQENLEKQKEQLRQRVRQFQNDHSHVIERIQSKIDRINRVTK